MPITITPDWDTSWTATSIASSAVADTASDTTAAISLDGVSGVEVSVTIAYGGTFDEGVMVYVLRDIDGTNYEAVADGPWQFEMPGSTSTTYRRQFHVPAITGSSIKVHLVNDSGASVTASVSYKAASMKVAAV